MHIDHVYCILDEEVASIELSSGKIIKNRCQLFKSFEHFKLQKSRALSFLKIFGLSLFLNCYFPDHMRHRF